MVFASSNLPNDRLGEILLREGKITVEEYEASIKAITKGKRQGKVLVEMGALVAQGPVGGRAVPGEGDRLQHLPVGRGPVPFRGVDAAGEGAHHRRPRHPGPDPGRAAARGRQRPHAGPLPGGRRRAGARAADVPAALEPYEEHVLAPRGRRAQRARHLPRERDRRQRDAEGALRARCATRRACASRARRSAPWTRTSCPRTRMYSVLDSFNQMYGYIFKYMVREVGPIAENVLEKYLGTPARRAQGRLRGRQAAEGRHPRRRRRRAQPQQVPRGRSGAALLVDALNELLYAELLAVKRTLGAEHEAAIVKRAHATDRREPASRSAARSSCWRWPCCGRPGGCGGSARDRRRRAHRLRQERARPAPRARARRARSSPATACRSTAASTSAAPRPRAAERARGAASPAGRRGSRPGLLRRRLRAAGARARIDGHPRRAGGCPSWPAGTGLYLRALLPRAVRGPVPGRGAARARLEALADRCGDARLHRLLARVDPESAARIEPRDRVRVVRALEVYRATRPAAQRAPSRRARRRSTGFDVRVLGLDPAARARCARRWRRGRDAMLARRAARRRCAALLARYAARPAPAAARSAIGRRSPSCAATRTVDAGAA